MFLVGVFNAHSAYAVFSGGRSSKSYGKAMNGVHKPLGLFNFIRAFRIEDRGSVDVPVPDVAEVDYAYSILKAECADTAERVSYLCQRHANVFSCKYPGPVRSELGCSSCEHTPGFP